LPDLELSIERDRDLLYQHVTILFVELDIHVVNPLARVVLNFATDRKTVVKLPGAPGAAEHKDHTQQVLTHNSP
jgi:hypothetical protein